MGIIHMVEAIITTLELSHAMSALKLSRSKRIKIRALTSESAIRAITNSITPLIVINIRTQKKTALILIE